MKDAIAYEFERAGYKVHFNIIRAEEHGVPSKRARMFISNIKLKLKKRKENQCMASDRRFTRSERRTLNTKPCI